MSNKVQITIDGILTEAGSEETILSAASRLGIEIPTLCYMKDYSGLESCGLCIVEVEGESRFPPACVHRVDEGMVVRTDTPALREARKGALELLLSDHLGDCMAPCEQACPANIDIPGFLRFIRDHQPMEALAVIKKSIAFPGILGRICPKYCEKICRRGKLDEPVSICALKRYPSEHDARALSHYRPEAKPASGKHVAIIGAGITGLTAAYYLLQEGHACTIYEAGDQAGGAMTSVIPHFRLPRNVVDTELERIVDLGLKIRFNQELGRDFKLDDLGREYDAVLLATGAGAEELPEFAGSEHAGSCLELLRQAASGLHHKENIKFEGKALVIGSGMMALDACRTLIRLGAESVKLATDLHKTASLYFRSQLQYALNEGIDILDLTHPERIEQLRDDTYRVHLQRGGNPIVLEQNMIYLAGQIRNSLDFLNKQGLEISKDGVKADHRSLTTNLPGIFAAGNVLRPGRLAVHASAAARRAAGSISRYLAGDDSEEKRPVNVRMPLESVPDIAIYCEEHTKAGRTGEQHQSPAAMKDPFAEVDAGIPDELVSQEAARCLNCDCAAKKECSLRDYSTEYGADPIAFGGERLAFERDTSHDQVIYESGKCIKCGRCIAVAEKSREPLGLTYIGRGFHVKVGVALNGTIREGLREAALDCVQVCPTGALFIKRTK